MSNLGGKNVSEDTDKDLSVDSIVAGSNIDNIDSTDPRNPIINASAGGGEVNTASNQGAGVGKVFKQKTGVDLELKSIKGGTDITISNDTDEVTINADNQLNNTTKGDLEVFTTVAARLAVGTNGQVLTADSAEASGLKWVAAAAGDPLTTKGDVFTFDTDAQRLAVGTNGQLLSADSAEATGLKWIAAPSGDPLTTKGDIMAFDTDADRVPIGTNDQVLTADSTNAFGLAWKDAAAGGAAVVSFHGALVQEETDTARGSTGFTVTYDDEVFDTDGFATLGTDNDRFTIPAGVTKVKVNFFIDYTSMATTSNNHVRIRQFDSSDVFIRAYDHGWVAGGDTSMGHAIATPVTPVAVGDYFTVTMTSTDTSWTQTQVNFSIDYQDGTLVEAVANAFHGAKASDSDTVARTATALINTYDTEEYDTDGFVTISGTTDRITIPANVTKVQLTGHIDATGIAAATAGYIAISHFNSADALQREYGSSIQTGNTLRTQMATTPVIEVVAGDYFKMETDYNDSSWSQIYVELSLEYKEGTL